jgi:hypothetical protein
MEGLRALGFGFAVLAALAAGCRTMTPERAAEIQAHCKAWAYKRLPPTEAEQQGQSNPAFEADGRTFTGSAWSRMD